MLLTMTVRFLTGLPRRGRNSPARSKPVGSSRGTPAAGNIPTALRAVAGIAAVALVIAAGWLANDTVHTMAGPWGEPGTPGTLTLTGDCVTHQGGEGDAPTMTCRGTYIVGGMTVEPVYLDFDHVGSTPATVLVRLPHGSRHAYQPSTTAWLLRLILFVVMLAMAGAALRFAFRRRRT